MNSNNRTECPVCGKEHRYNINLNVGDYRKSICPTCFFLCAPTYSQMIQIDPDVIKKSSDYPELDSLLYSKIASKYQAATHISKPIEAENEFSYDADMCKNGEKKKEKNQMELVTNIWPDSPFEGRQKEIQDIYDILSRKNKRNALIIGPSGVGKTALVAHIAWEIKKGNVPASLSDKKMLSLNIDSLIAGTKYRGDLEEKINKLFKSLDSTEKVILFIDDMQSLSKGHSEAENTSIGNIIKPYIENGQMQLIGTTTAEGYRTYIESDMSLSRLFYTVQMEEEPASKMLPIIKAVVPGLEQFHGVSISDNVIEDCIKLADRYIKYRAFPDKAIDLLDMACARNKNSLSKDHPENKRQTAEDVFEMARPHLKSIPAGIDILGTLFGSQYFAPSVKKCSIFLQEKEDERLSNNKSAIIAGALSFNDLADVVEAWTKIPVNTISQTQKKQLKQLAPTIKSRVIGQDEAVDKVISAVCRRRLGITKSSRPASFIFVGETGIGKTELAKSLAKSLFGSEDNLVRFDMSEYMEAHSVAKLIGAPPGYVGYNEPGQLTEVIKRKPFSVVLFDEIEKANADVSNILLQLLDDGRITDAKGNTVDASNAIVILTSNAGATLTKGLGFGRSETESTQSGFEKGLKNHFRPEFLGRVDDIIYFNNLTPSDYEKIAVIYLEKLKSNLAENNIKLNYSEEVPSLICQKANTAKFHAREIKRTVVKEIENLITDTILDFEDDISSIDVFLHDGHLEANVKQSEPVEIFV